MNSSSHVLSRPRTAGRAAPASWRTWSQGRWISGTPATAAQVLIVTAKTLRDRGGELVLLHPQRPVARVLELLGAGEVITVAGWPVE